MFDGEMKEYKNKSNNDKIVFAHCMPEIVDGIEWHGIEWHGNSGQNVGKIEFHPE